MLKHINDSTDMRGILLSLMSTSGTLAGISLALVGIIGMRSRTTSVETIADDLFLFSSLGFVIVCYFTYFALRHIHSVRAPLWAKVIDVVFFISLTLLMIAGFITVYVLV